MWAERNALWHGGGGRSITDSVRWVMETTFDLAQMGKKQLSKPAKLVPQWRKPLNSTLKINVDACFRQDVLQGATVEWW